MRLATIFRSIRCAVSFDVDERIVLGLRRSVAGLKGDGGPGLPSVVGLADEKDFPHQANLESTDSPDRSSYRQCPLAGPVSEPDGLLMPGMFVRVRLVTSPPRKALLVPERTIGSDQGQKFVFVATDQNVAQRRAVKTGDLDDDGMRIVEEGLTENDRVPVAGRRRRPARRRPSRRGPSRLPLPRPKQAQAIDRPFGEKINLQVTTEIRDGVAQARQRPSRGRDKGRGLGVAMC